VVFARQTCLTLLCNVTQSSWVCNLGVIGKRCNSSIQNKELAMQIPALLQRLPELARLPQPLAETAGITVRLARTEEELRAAQRLRYKVFAQEYNAHLNGGRDGLDVDMFDAFCDHLIAVEQRTDRVLGTYRMLTPQAAKRLGQRYVADEFLIDRLAGISADMVEFGRSCVHPDFRNSTVLLALWSGLAQYMRKHNLRYALGCSSTSLIDGGANARTTWDLLRSTAMADETQRVFPINRLQIEHFSAQGGHSTPLIAGYARLGAKLLGDPAWDPDFNTADFPMLLDLQALPARYARHFGLA
jgi:putative hemolysin